MKYFLASKKLKQWRWPGPEVKKVTLVFKMLMSCAHVSPAIFMHTDGNRSWDAAPSIRTAEYRLRLTREKHTVMMGILAGHCKLNKHLYQLGGINDQMCRGCEEEQQTMEYLIYHYPAMTEICGTLANMAMIADAPTGSLFQLILNRSWHQNRGGTVGQLRPST